MKLIVMESQGVWAAALRRLPAGAASIRETRSLPECEAELVATPASFVVAELLLANASALLDRMTAWEARFPAAVFAVVAGRELASWGELVREAGAIDFVTSPRELTPLSVAIARHFERKGTAPRSLADRILAELPLAPS